MNHETHEMTRKSRRSRHSLAAFLKHCHSERLVEALSREGKESLNSIRWVSPPQSSLPGAPAVQGVALAPNEDVQWTWTHTANGSYVSGYSIRPRFASIRGHSRSKKHGR